MGTTMKERRKLPRFPLHVKTHEVNKIDDLRNHMIDHVLLLRENKVYLMIHGNEQGIVYNESLVNFQDLSKLVREELHLNDNDYLNLKVFCCYALSQQEYSDESNRISTVFDNQRELYFALNKEDNICNFFVM